MDRGAARLRDVTARKLDVRKNIVNALVLVRNVLSIASALIVPMLNETLS